jgi:hypothetical protein
MPNDHARQSVLTLLEILGLGDERLTFQTYTDSKEKPTPDPLAAWRHGTYRKQARWLSDQNDRGAACAVVPQLTDGNGRSKSNVTAIKSLVLDLDGAPLEPVLTAAIPPAAVIRTSPGRHHAYWPITGLPVHAFTRAQRELAARFDGDVAVSDPSRCMRLCGYLNHKHGDPFSVQLIQHDYRRPHDWLDFAEEMGLTGPAQKAKITEGSRNYRVYAFACKLFKQHAHTFANVVERCRKFNRRECLPPLSDAEVSGIIANAAKSQNNWYSPIPFSLTNSPEFMQASIPCQLFVLNLCFRYDPTTRNNGRLAFTRKDAEARGFSESRRAAAKAEAIARGLIEQTGWAISATKDKPAQPEFFLVTHLPHGQMDA